MNIWRIKVSLFLTYVVFAILLNSVGTVILQVINSYGVSKESASVLEGFKDLPIAMVSFLVASFLPRFGYKKAMMLGLVIVTLACAAMPLWPGFAATKVLFFCVGVAFALIKISVYSIVGVITADRQQHASLLNTIEGLFMVGVLAGYWLFGSFIGDRHAAPLAWLDVYWLLAGLCLVNLLVLATTRLEEPASPARASSIGREFAEMGKLAARPMVFVFVISAFLYVLIEQGIGTWLPTFNNEILKLPAAMSVQATSIFAASLAIGRLGAGALMQRWHWYPLLNLCILAIAALVLLTLPLTRGIAADPGMSWGSAPVAAYLFPLIGLFMAPIYPAINSVVLSALPGHRHAQMTGLIVLFSALGGTTGSLITGQVFARFSGQTAFYFCLVPLSLILVALYFFKRQTEKQGELVAQPS